MKFRKYIRAIALALVLVFALCAIVSADAPHWIDVTVTPLSEIFDYYFGSSGQTSGSRGGTFGDRGGFGGSRGYYTDPTTTTVDGNGNATNYYRSGNTTNVDIVNTVNRTFNSFQSNDYRTYNTTQNYNNQQYWTVQANVDLSNFLNTYNYTQNNYSYDVTFNEYTYNTTNNTYYITIDNSTNNYYDIEYTYTPTSVEVSYISKNSSYSNVTNIYYYELNDGRNSSTLTLNEINGLDVGVGVGNYAQVAEDSGLLSLQHFDGTYADSSAFNRTPIMNYRSMNYIDHENFGKAVKLNSGWYAGAEIIGAPGSGADLHYSIGGYRVIDFMYMTSGSVPKFSLYSGDNFIIGVTDVVHRIRWIDGAEGQPSATGNYPSVTDVSLDTPYFYDARGYLDVFACESDYIEPAPGNMMTYYYSYAGNKLSDATNMEPNIWYSFRFVYRRLTGELHVFINGVKQFSFSMPDNFFDSIYFQADADCYLDELRVYSSSDFSLATYEPPAAPFDSNLIFALPDDPVAGNVYVRSAVPASHIRVGGVRPSAPETGFVYIPLDSNYKGAGCQQYDGSNWQEVDGYIYDTDGWHNVIGYQFWTVGQAQDVTEPEVDDPTPTDSPGNGGSGSGGNGSGSSADSDTFFSKLGELLGSFFGNGFKLFGAALSKVLDVLISLINTIGDKLAQLVEAVLGWFEEIPKLFTGFLDFLVLLFPYLPPEIMLLFTFGLAAVVFIGIIKAIRR